MGNNDPRAGRSLPTRWMRNPPSSTTQADRVDMQMPESPKAQARANASRSGGGATPDGGKKLLPPLKWAGGKRWLVPRLRAYWEKHRSRRLVEPFCGGLAVALGLMPRRALLGDVSQPLMNFYGWVKKGFAVTIPTENSAKAFYAHRARFNALLADERSRNGEEAAALFYYLNRTGYNGLCRFNGKGAFNVPFGKYKRIGYAKDFLAYREIFGKWEFRNEDFEALPISPGDFIYADPPYDVPFTKYAKRDFSWEDQVRLARFLGAHDGPVLLSNQATERIVRLYEEAGFSLEFIEGPRRISCTGDRSPAPEVLAVRGFSP